MDYFSLVQTSHSSLLVSFISLALVLVALIIGLCCIWRVERRLKIFLIILTVAVGLLGLEKLLDIIISAQSQSFVNLLELIDLVRSLLFVAAFGEMFRIITGLSKESRGVKEIKN